MTLLDPDATGSEFIHVGQTYPDIKKRGEGERGMLLYISTGISYFTLPTFIL